MLSDENDDLKDMRRIRKKSFAWYQQVIASKGKNLINTEDNDNVETSL